MPQLQVVEDPYAVSTAAAANNLASGMMGPGPEQLANYQVLAAKMREADAQQRKLAQDMRLAQQKSDWEVSDRKQRDTAADAAGRYWGYATPAPVGGAPQDMERYYREQNYRDQMARLMAQSGKSAEDIAKAMNDYQMGFQAAHPPTADRPSTMPDGSPIPVMPAGLSPDAQKKYNEQQGKQILDTQMDQIAGQTAARKKLPELLNMRDAWENVAGAGGVGGLSAQTPFRWVANAFGSDTEAARQTYEGVRATVLNQNSGDHKGEGAVSNYERELYGKPYAEVSATNPEVGRGRMADQFARTLRNIGLAAPAAQEVALHVTHGAPRPMIEHLFAELQRGNTAAVSQFLEAARADAQHRMGGR